MSRIVLVCPEPLGHGVPAGVGIRFLEFAKALLAEGHSVTVLSRDGGAVPNCRTAAITPATLRASTASADCAIVQGHAANELFAHGSPIPVVVDLYDPYIIENLHYHSTHGPQVFEHDYATLMRSLSRGDFFLCASTAQRHFYLGMLLAAGRVTPVNFATDPRLESLLAIAPFGVPPPRARRPSGDRHAILFGGIYDWYEPRIAVDAVALLRDRFPRISLTFTSHPNAEITPQSVAAATRDYVAVKQLDDVVKFQPWVAYDERDQFYDRFSVGLLTFPQSLETDLSMRTRIFDYLWAGLPVVTSSAPGTDEILQRYDAGIVVDSAAPSKFAEALDGIFSQSETYESLISGTQRFTVDHQWSRLLEPLLAFCRNPRRDETKRPAVVAEAPAAHPDDWMTKLRRKLRRRKA